MDGEIRWWTFAGGRINSTLRHALGAVNNAWLITPDNFVVRLQGEKLNHREFMAAQKRLMDPGFWENQPFWEQVAQTLPGYRLSKFQPLMPPWVEREVLSCYLLDVAGAWRRLSGAGKEGHEGDLGAGPVLP